MTGIGIQGKTMKQVKRRNKSANPISKRTMRNDKESVREKVKLLTDQNSLNRFEYDK